MADTEDREDSPPAVTEPNGPPRRVHLPVMGQSPRRMATAGASAGGAASARVMSGGGSLRYRLESTLRVFDKVVGTLVAAYDRLFELGEDEQAEIHLRMGTDLAREGRFEEALVALRKAARLEPDDGAPWVEIGSIQLRKGAVDAALKSLRNAEERGETSFRFFKLLAEAHVKNESVDEAVVALEQAEELRPDEAALPYRRGVLLDGLGRYDDAIEALERAVELEPGSVPYRQSLGFALESAGKRKAAIATFKGALELEYELESAE